MKPIAGYRHAQMDGEFVVFLIGIRINKFWKPWKWMPVAAAMPRMLIELQKNPELGLLHARNHFGLRNVMVVQYWKSFDHLHDYALAKDKEHLPAWRAFNKAVADNGDVGIWHETYIVKPGQYENVYGNMPPYGLGRAGGLVELTPETRWAKDRLGQKAAGGSPPLED